MVHFYTVIIYFVSSLINEIKSNDNVYSRVDTQKSDSNLNTLLFPRKSTE